MEAAIVDYGVSNLCSVLRALQHLGYDAHLTSDPKALQNAARIILPGQGAFATATRNLTESGMKDALDAQYQAGKPIMGICVGMQVMAQTGMENGNWSGLGWLDASCSLMEPLSATCKLPHVGWNELCSAADEPLLEGLNRKDKSVYFVHSYALECRNKADVVATCDYGGQFVAAVRKNNLFAVQFHPEKSQENGLRILDNFMNWKL